MGLIRFIFFILFFYLLFRLLGRLILPLMANNYVKKEKEKYYQQNPDARPPSGKEGDVHIRRSSDTKQKFNAESAEYVDYEEVDE